MNDRRRPELPVKLTADVTMYDLIPTLFNILDQH